MSTSVESGSTAESPASPTLEPPIDPLTLGRVHFIGAGGVGMSGLARIMLARRLPVSGSDAKDSVVLAGLRELGGQFHIGHDAAHVRDVDTVVVSSAITGQNPELAAAREAGLRVLHRSQLLAALMTGRISVAVAGTHGKTTTTSMTVVALEHCGADPSFAIGGELSGRSTDRASAHEGTGPAFVAEADESDASFLRYAPDVAVVTNVEPDHLDHYGSADAVHDAFAAFTERITPGGLLIIGTDDAGAAALAERVRRRAAETGSGLRVITYGCAAGSDVRLTQVDLGGPGSSAELEVSPGVVVRGGQELPSRQSLRLAVPGSHNVANATAAWIVACELGIPTQCAADGLAGFGGTRRRFELIGRAGGVEVRDDYAHHPTEVTAALKAARAVAPGRLVVLFQPHLYSRTRLFATEFATALALADEVLVLDVYGAREEPEPGVSGALISAAVPLPSEHVRFVPTLDEAVATLSALVQPGDLVLTMGAGDVTTVAPRLVETLPRHDQGEGAGNAG